METITTTTTKAVPVMLPVDHWSLLKQEGLATGRSASAIIRDLVTAHLQGKRPRSEKKRERTAIS